MAVLPKLDLPRSRDGERRVIATFDDCDLSFTMPSDATLAELAERLAHFAEAHGGMPSAIDVRIAR